MKKYISTSPADTKKFAERILKKIKGGAVLGLVGELGSGKTVFVQGLAKAFGVKKTVNSPTFVIMKIYDIRESRIANRDSRIIIRQLIHVDAYRINNYQELLDIGLGEYLNKKENLVVIEWAEKTPEIKKVPGYREVRFTPGKSDNMRVISYNQ